MKQSRNQGPLRPNPLNRRNSRSPTSVHKQTFAASIPPPEFLKQASFKRADFRARPQGGFKKRDIESRTPNMRDVRRRDGDYGAPRPLDRSFLKQRIDADASRTDAKFDEESDDLRGRTLDPWRLPRQVQAIRVDLDVHSELTPAHRGQQANRPGAEHNQWLRAAHQRSSDQRRPGRIDRGKSGVGWRSEHDEKVLARNGFGLRDDAIRTDHRAARCIDLVRSEEAPFFVSHV
jgi:hypothetical protein